MQLGHCCVNSRNSGAVLLACSSERDRIRASHARTTRSRPRWRRAHARVPQERVVAHPVCTRRRLADRDERAAQETARRSVDGRRGAPGRSSSRAARPCRSRARARTARATSHGFSECNAPLEAVLERQGPRLSEPLQARIAPTGCHHESLCARRLAGATLSIAPQVLGLSNGTNGSRRRLSKRLCEVGVLPHPWRPVSPLTSVLGRSPIGPRRSSSCAV